MPDFGSYGVNLQQEPEEIFAIDTQFGVLPQEPEPFGGKNGCGIVQEEEEVDVEINSGSSGGGVKQEHDNLDDECSRKR